jgi:hypothetical protein
MGQKWVGKLASLFCRSNTYKAAYNHLDNVRGLWKYMSSRAHGSNPPSLIR